MTVVDGNGTSTTYSLDAVGNRTKVVTTLDTTPPGAPTGLTATPASQTQINLSWTAASDTTGSAIAGYYVFRGSTQVGTSTTTTYSDTGLLGWTTYSYYVQAYDNATPPNVSAVSSTASARTLDQTAPTVPAGLTATAASQTQINLSWSPSTDSGGSGLAGYKIYRSDLGSTPFATTTTTSYSNTGLSSYVTYTYTVVAYDNAGNLSAQSTAASAKTPDLTDPTVPSGLSATAVSQTQINLTWTAATDSGASGLAGYKIYRSDQGSTPIATTATTSYSNTGLNGYTAYTYTVAAYSNAGDVSAQSSPATATTPDSTAPTVPTGLTATAASQTQINLSWTAATDTGGSGLAGYKIYRSDQGSTPIATSTTASYSNTGLSGFTNYTYTVAAYDHAGNASAQSTSASAKTPDQTPPTAPSNFAATAVSPNQVNLSWGASTDSGGSGLGSYHVFRNSVSIATLAYTALSYSDTTVSPSTAYTYSVQASDNATPTPNTTQSASANVTTPASGPPSVPGTPAPNGIVTSLSWTETWGTSTGAVAYYILSSNNAGTITTYNITAPTTSSVQNGANGARIHFSVQACNSSNQCSAASGTSTVQICSGGCP